MTHKEYNGWTNYETWLVKLWIDNEQGSQDYWIERAEQNVKDDEDGDIRALAEAGRIRGRPDECSLVRSELGGDRQ